MKSWAKILIEHVTVAALVGWATTAIVVALVGYFGAAHLGLNTLLLLIVIALLLTQGSLWRQR